MLKMNINRNNYEEFFLLYVDNELSAPEKSVVEIFLENNPDLQEEMIMLQQSIVKPDAVVFENKQSLLKEEAVAEADEKLLLLLDNELNGEEKAAVEKLIANNTPVKAAWDIFQQTKLAADDAVVFEDKQSLYRKEAGRVVALRWWRVSVAAACIGFALLAGITYYINAGKTVASETAVTKPAPIKNNKPPETNQSQQKLPAVGTSVTETVTENESIQKEKIPLEKISVQKEKILPRSLDKNENDAVAGDDKNNQKPSNNLPEPYFEKLNSPASNNNDIATVLPKTQEVNSNEIKDKSNEDAVASVVPTSFTDNSTEDKSQPLLEEENKKGRTKLGGFFKKMKRLLERKTNTTSNGNNIKVANMSFAVQ